MAVQGVRSGAFGHRPKNRGALQLQYAPIAIANGASLCARSMHEARGGGSRTAGSSKGVDGECSREGELCGIGGRRHVVAVQNRVGQVCQAATADVQTATLQSKGGWCGQHLNVPAGSTKKGEWSAEGRKRALQRGDGRRRSKVEKSKQVSQIPAHQKRRVVS